MLYRANYVDGSVELIEAGDIRKARTAAQKLFDVGVKNVVVQDEPPSGDEEDVEDEDVEDEERGK